MNKVFYNYITLKLKGDLKVYKGRLLLISLSVFIGISIVTAIMGSQSTLRREVSKSFLSGIPPHGIFHVESTSPEVLEKISNFPGITAVEPRRVIRGRIEVAPNDWRMLFLFGINDFENVSVSRFSNVSGDNTPGKGTLLVEQSSLSLFGHSTGGSYKIRLPGKKFSQVKVSGVVHDTSLAPGWQDNIVYGYVSRETLSFFGVGNQFNQIRVRTETDDRKGRGLILNKITDLLRKEEAKLHRVELPVMKHPHHDHMQSMLMLLSIFGLFALLLVIALSWNVFTGLLSKQVKEIGILKAIGSNRFAIFKIYFVMVLVPATFGSIAALPLGNFLSQWFSKTISSQMNIEALDLTVSPHIYLFIFLLGVSIPTLGALIPIFQAARLKTAHALNAMNIESNPHRFSLGKRFSSLVFRFSLRNSFRNPFRLALTVTALSLGGAMLLTATNVYKSLQTAVESAIERRGDDIDVKLLKPVSTDSLRSIIGEVEGIKYFETWPMVLTTFSLPDSVGDMTSSRYAVYAPPQNTKLFKMPISKGRWPGVEEKNTIVINKVLQGKEGFLKLESKVHLVIRGEKVEVLVVGIFDEVAGPSIYTNPGTITQLPGLENKSGTVRVQVENSQNAESMAAKIENRLAENGIIPLFLMSRNTLKKAMSDHFMILLVCLLIAALSAIAVGAIGLATTMNINVQERIREIGVIRSIGAAPKVITKVIFFEGGSISLLSTLFALVISIPLSLVTCSFVGEHSLHINLPFQISLMGILLLWTLILIVTIIGVVFPIRTAIKLSIPSVLAYE